MNVDGYDRTQRRRAGEIDLIARRGQLLEFAEVKNRATLQDAVGAVGAHSRKRIERAADMFVAKNQGLAQCDMRYDIVAVSGWHLRHLADAWRYDE